ncbi:hypothetical protein [Peribacillus simplex]|uniref:hypothetical protein n=1 Tax=Peribacillus simplex TaxID=1478 RepID=UPI003D275FEC
MNGMKRNNEFIMNGDFKALRELKKLLTNIVAFADAIKAVISMDIEGKNAVKSPSVFTDEIRLSKRELEELIHKTVKKAIEEEREIMLEWIPPVEVNQDQANLTPLEFISWKGWFWGV